VAQRVQLAESVELAAPHLAESPEQLVVQPAVRLAQRAEARLGQLVESAARLVRPARLAQRAEARLGQLVESAARLVRPAELARPAAQLVVALESAHRRAEPMLRAESAAVRPVQRAELAARPVVPLVAVLELALRRAEPTQAVLRARPVVQQAVASASMRPAQQAAQRVRAPFLQLAPVLELARPAGQPVAVSASTHPRAPQMSARPRRAAPTLVVVLRVLRRAEPRYPAGPQFRAHRTCRVAARYQEWAAA
jgi:hypothetical protein